MSEDNWKARALAAEAQLDPMRTERDELRNIAETAQRQFDELNEITQQLQTQIGTALDQRDKLAAFKKFVHERLDRAGVPHDPEPEATARHGCRVEGRLNWLECAAQIRRTL